MNCGMKLYMHYQISLHLYCHNYSENQLVSLQQKWVDADGMSKIDSAFFENEWIFYMDCVSYLPISDQFSYILLKWKFYFKEICASPCIGSSEFSSLVTMTSQWAPWRLKSPTSGLFVQPFSGTHIKENIKDPHHLPLWGESTGDQWFPAQRACNAENGSIWWRHHALLHRAYVWIVASLH